MEKWLTGTRMYLFSGSLSPDRLSLLKNLQRATSHLALLFCRKPTTTRFHFLEVETKLKQATGCRGALRKTAAVNIHGNKPLELYAVQYTSERTIGNTQN